MASHFITMCADCGIDINSVYYFGGNRNVNDGEEERDDRERKNHPKESNVKSVVKRLQLLNWFEDSKSFFM